MEGDGEGLVAIVQGLENSGVTLTVCNRPRQNSDRSRPPGQRIQINAVNQRTDAPAADQRPNTLPAVAAPPAMSTTPAVQRSSVETSTGADFSRMATASQICDGRYASSYKLAHCMVSPTSPPEAVTEFPPQRKEPCRNQGNFEIGGQGSAQWSSQGIRRNVSTHGGVPARVSTSRVRHYGGTQTWADKGSSHRYSKSNHRETEAFAHSLRKYPSMAPFRTASTDLIEKLIRYTQAKNYQEMSRSTKSLRSLRHQKSSDTYETVRASKHQQTYTRGQDENVTTNSNVHVGYRGRTRNFKLFSPMSDSRNLRENRCRETTFNSSYDYLKSGNPPYGRSNRSDGSPSPTCSRSPQRRRSLEESPSPDRSQSPDRSRSPEGSRVIRPDRSSRTDRSLRFDRSVRDLSLSEMSRYIRSTIRQICNERPVVVQVCPKLKDRFNQHKKVCPNKNEKSSDVMEFEEEEEDPEDQASGSVLSRFLQSFSGRPVHSTEQTGCQCTRADCYCSKATQCVNNPDVATNTAACSCITVNTRCCRGMPCVCANKAQDQAYFNKRIDDEISEWLKDVPVTSIEDSESKKRRETIIKELRKTLKQLPDDENFEENAANEIQGFVDDFPLWNPGKDENDEKLFKNQLADKLTEKIIAIPRKPDRFRDIVRKWVANLDFEDDGEEVDMEVIIDNFVNRLKSLAADRPACDVKYTNILRKEIIELLVELALKFDGDMIMLKKVANNLAKEVVSIPRNVNLSGDTSDLTSEFEDKIADWICEHGLCKELKKDPKLIEGLAKKLNKLKSQGIYDDDVIEKMKEEVQQFVDDVGLAFETIDELIEELMKQLSSTIQIKEKERLDFEELSEEVNNWLRSLPGDGELHPRKLEIITKDLVKMIQDNNEQENENLANDIVYYLVDTDLSIDSADLGIYVEELMEKLNILPSDKFYKEQAKRVMLKDIYNIIESSPIPEDKKEKMRSRAQRIVELNLRKSSLTSRHPTDNVKAALLQDMDDAIIDIDIPKESRLQLKSLLSISINRNYDKSFTRLNREKSDLKEMISKDVINAVKELPIDADKKKNLMNQVRESLSKNMNKPLPSNIKDNINDDISDIIEKCPICEDRNVLGRIKKVLSEVASKHLTIYLPPCLCDIQNEVEEDVSIVIGKSSIDMGQKRELKESIQDILAENEDRRLSDEVVKTIKDDISSIVSDLSIPQDKKDDLKKAVNETVSEDFKEAGKAFRHDLNKIRNKLLDDITNVIEKSPIKRDVKSHLKDKLNTVLAKNLDSSLSDEEKHMVLDEVSNIVRDDMPEEKRISLTNKLAKKLHTQQRKEETKGLIETINRLSIDSSVKDDMKKEIKAIFLETLYNPLSDEILQKLEEDVKNAIDQLDIPEQDKNNLKTNISHAMTKELEKLIAQDKEVPQIKITLEKVITNEIKNSPISLGEQEKLVNKTKVVLTENLTQVLTDEVKETIRERLSNIVGDLITDKDKADAIKTQLLTVVSKNFSKSTPHRPRANSNESLQDQKQTMDLEASKNKTIDNILLEMECAVNEAPVPKEKKTELKNKLKNIAIKNFKKPLDKVSEGLKNDISEIFGGLNLPKDKKNRLKSVLHTAVDKNIVDLQEKTKYIDTQYPDTKRGLSADDTIEKNGNGLVPKEIFSENKVKDSVFHGIEEIIEQSAVPEGKKIALKRKLKKLTAENLKRPYSNNVQDTINIGIDDTVNELPIPTSEKNKLKGALTNMVDEKIENLRAIPRIVPTEANESGDKPLHKIFQEMDRGIEEASIPRGKKKELKKKLKNLATKDFKQIPKKDVEETLKGNINEIIDRLNLSKDKKNKLKNVLLNAVSEYMSNLQAADDKSINYPTKNRRSNEDSTYNKIEKGLKPLEEVDATTVKDSIMKGIEKNIEESAIPERQKTELKRKLKTMAAENLKKPFSQEVQNTIKTGMADIIDDLPISKSEKNKLKSELTSIVDENVDNYRVMPSDQVGNLRKSKDIPLHDIFQEMERTIEEASIPREKKQELKKRLKNLVTKDFKKIRSEDIAESIEDDMIEITDELNLPQDKKNKLRRALLTAVGEYMRNLQTSSVDKYTEFPAKNRRPIKDTTYNKIGQSLKPTEEVDIAIVKNSILKGIEKNIEESAVPEGKKTELKRKLKTMATENLKWPVSKDVQHTIKTGIVDIIDDLEMSKSEKNKLKNELTRILDENFDNLQAKPSNEVGHLKKLEDKPLHNIFQEMDCAIDKASIPKEKKIKLKTKLKNLASKDFKNIPSEDIAETIEADMIEITDELNLPKDKKNKLKSALLTAVGEYTSNLQTARDDKDYKYPAKNRRPNVDRTYNNIDKGLKPVEKVDATKVKDSIMKGIEKNIEKSAVPEGKKSELKIKLKTIAAENLKKPFSQDVQDSIKTEIADIINDLPISKSEKNKLKRELTNIVDENVDNLRVKPSDHVVNLKKSEDKLLQDIFQEMDRVIEEVSIPRENKKELKKELKNLATKDFKKIPKQDVAEILKDNINEIIDELNLSQDKKSKLKSALLTAVDKSNLQTARDDRDTVYSNKNQRPNVDRTYNKIDKGLKPIEEVDATKVKDSILKGIETIIEESAVPQEKKVDLKRKLKKVAAENLKKPFSEDVQEATKNNMEEILGHLQIPNTEKNKLKSELTSMVNKNMDNLRVKPYQINNSDELEDISLDNILREMERTIEEAPREKKMESKKLKDETKLKDTIFQGIEKVIEESAVPERKKSELKRKLKTVAVENFEEPPKDVQANIKTAAIIADIIDDLPIPKSEKNKLKSELTSMVNENMDNFRSKPRDQIDHSEKLEAKPLHNIFQEMDQTIKEAYLPKEKKIELKKMLQDLATKDFDNRSLDEVAEALKDGMIQIIDEINLPRDKKNNLKSTLTNMIDENMVILRGQPSEPSTQGDNLNELVDETQRNILQGFEKVIDEALIPKEKKLELKRKLINRATKNFKEPLSDEVSEALKDDISLIIDELNLAKDKKNQLKIALTDVVDENMSNYKNENTLTKSSRYQHISPDKRRKISYPRHIIDESNLKESIKEEVKKSVLQSNIDRSKKSRLNLDLLRMISGMLAEFDEAIDERMKYIFDKYGIKPDYQTTLAEEFDKLLEIALKGGDFRDARRKLIAKLMRELNFSEELAIALTDEMIDLAREMAHKKGVENILQAQGMVTKDTLHDEVTPMPKERPFLQEQKDKITECKGAFAKAINNAIDQSTISKANKSSLKNKLLNKLKKTIDESPNKNDTGALIAEVLLESNKIVDASSIPTGKKKEIKLLLKKELTKEFGDDIIDDEESSDDGEADDVSEAIAEQESPTPEEYKEKIIECIKTWMDSLPMDFDPEVVTAVAEDLASDILDRQKYFQTHPEAISADNDEIENLKYQVFRRMNNDVDPKDMPLIMDRTEDLYRMIMDLETPEGVPKLRQTSSREQSSSEKRRRDQAPPDRKRSASATLSTGNINYSLKELIATNKSVRRQWSRHLDNALSKLPLLRTETKDLKDKLAIYDETGQINILSALSRTKEETNIAESSKSSKQAPKPALKNNKGKMSARLSKIEEAFAFNNTTKQKTPFTPKSNEATNVKEFTQKIKDIINTWLKKARVDIDQNEKDRILEELANDIIDRQKYLQTFGETPTQSENLEYLKLQIHRRLNGLVPVEILKQMIENTKDLVPQIDKVRVPQLVQVPQLAQEPQKSPSPTQRKLGPADILGIRSKATNTTTADGVPHTIDDDDGVEDDSEKEFSPGQASTPSKSAAEQQEAADAEYFEKVIESVTNWLESMPIDLDPEVKSDVINDLASDIVDRQKYLQVHPDKKFSDEEEIENLRFQVFKRLDKVLEPDSSVTPSSAKIEELYKMTAGDGRKKTLTAKQAQEFQTALNEEISAILNNYHICCDKRMLLPKLANELTKLRKSGADQDEIVENLIAIIQPLTYLSDEDAEELAYKLLYRTKKLIATIRGDVPVKKKDFKEAMLNDIGDVFEGCPMSEAKRRLMENHLAEGYAKDLGIPLEESNATMNDTGTDSKKTRYGMSFNGLSNFIDTWLSSIHSDDDDTKDEDEIMDEKRERMYCLVHKIGEMNVDPEIFNDDSLYEAVLREELQHLLGDIKIDEEEFQALKEDLIEKVLEAQRRAHDEIAGQNYKKNLRDTMSKLLPDQRNFSKEDQATIETLKDQLADAYIDLHYSGNNENQRDRLKRKITNEINTFCKDYLNRNPCSPLNSKTLNHDLYTALNKVPLPPGDSIRYEVEQARIREEINDWIKELPLQPQSPTELLTRSKLIYVLSKKLFDIEVDEQEEDEDNELMRKHIVKFLNKLPLESEEENDAIADTLINKLKASEQSRKYDATSNVTIDASGNVSAASNESSAKASVCQGYKWLIDKRKTCAPRKVCAQHPPRRFESFPPCTLSPEDRAHLENIRQRTCLSPSCVTSLIKKHKCLSGAGPPPVDAGSQTVLRPFGVEEPQQKRICPFAYEKMPKPCPRVSANLPHQPYAQGQTESVEIEKPKSSAICPAAFEKTPRICPAGPSRSPQPGHQIRRHTISSSNISDCNEEVQPQILLKQYYWDPCDKNSVEDSEQQQSGRSSRRQSDAASCHPPGPPPCHPPRPCRPAPCGSPRPAPCSPPRPVPCSPPKPAPCRPAPCSSTRPATCRPPPCQPPRPTGCHPPGPCDPNPACFSQPTSAPCRRPSSGKLKQQSSPQSKSPRQNSSERYSYCDPQNSFQRSGSPHIERVSHRDIPTTRSPCSPSPCMSSFGQYTPPGSPGFSKRFNECRMPKRDGLQDQVPSTSSRPSQKERVIELGSLDDVSARPKKRPSDQSDWPKFHEDDNFWAAPMRRVILDEGIDESVVMERERREERVTCRCKERLIPKNGRSQPGNCPSQPFPQTNEDGQNLKRCSKCCGIHCPYPSFLYFRQ